MLHTMILVQVKYLPHTGSRCSRFRASAVVDGQTFKTVASYDYSLGINENRRAAAKRFCDETQLGYGELSRDSAELGGNTVGYVYTLTPFGGE